MNVFDASAVLEVLLRTKAGLGIEGRLLGGEPAGAPHLLDVEVVQVLRRYVGSGQIDAGRGGEAVADLAALPLQRYPHDLLLDRVWELRDNLSAYDAVYVALAELLEAPLLTRDRRLASAPGHRARVEVV